MARYPNGNPVVASGAVTASGASAAFKLDEPSEYVSIIVSTTAIVSTPSTVFTVEWSNDGVTFAQADTADTFTAITAAPVAHVKDFSVKGLYMRLVWTMTGGTSPSLTFSATASTRGSRAFEG